MEGTPGIPGGDPRFVEMNDRVREGLRKAGMREGERPAIRPKAASMCGRSSDLGVGADLQSVVNEGRSRPERSANRGS